MKDSVLRVVLLFSVISVTVQGMISTSKLQVEIPRSLKKPEGYDHRDAMFGAYPAGQSIQQQLVYIESTLCSTDYVNITTQGYPKRDAGDMTMPFILMMDRGDCTFVKKVRNAQRMGATAALIADSQCLCSHENCPNSGICEDTEPIMADDGSGADISIPSFLMFKEDADPIKQILKQNQQVRISMTFSTPPSEDGVVDYDLWTTPADPLARSIIMSFKPAAIALGNRAKFTPHSYIYDGKLAGCVDANGHNTCFSLCTNSGRYCSTDPDDDLEQGISGADVVKESLRRECIWNRYGEDGVGKKWWDYVDEFMFRCGDPQKPDFFTNEDCIADAMKHAGVDKRLIDQCMLDSGGLEGNVRNSILEAKLDLEVKMGVMLIPSLFVDQAPVRGAPSFSNLFQAICAGYAQGSEPEVCATCVHCMDQQICVEQGYCEHPTAMSVTGSARDSVPVSTFAGSVLLLVAIFISVAYWHRSREQRHMHDHVRAIMAEYVPLPES